jgi:endogenous inhibitor of DNA gyrase (YacG/DUF329 family)
MLIDFVAWRDGKKKIPMAKQKHGSKSH